MLKNEIIYIAPNLTSFVKEDIRGLSEFYTVKTNIYNWTKKVLIPILMIKQLFFLLKFTRSSKAIIISFGGYWSVFPVFIGKLLTTPTFIILNGTDSASIPEINYGSLRKKWFRMACEFSYKNCSQLLPVSQSLMYTENKYLFNKPIKIGIHHYFPQLKTPYKVVNNGLNENFWVNQNGLRESLSFVTVLSTGKEELKGGDLIIKLASSLPKAKFYIVGAEASEKVPSNVYYLGRKTPEQLREIYNKGVYYFQLSVFEGFGCALCEAMLCGCIPIVSNVNMLPEIVDHPELILKERNQSALLRLVEQTINNTSLKTGQFRSRVVNNFSFTKRMSELKELLG